jgi:hypothetical protein
MSSIGNFPGAEGLIMLANDTLLVIMSSGNYICRYVSPSSCVSVVGTGTAGFSGDGGPASAAQIHYPMKGYGDPSNAGRFWFADTNNMRIRKVRSCLPALLDPHRRVARPTSSC